MICHGCIQTINAIQSRLTGILLLAEMIQQFPDDQEYMDNMVKEVKWLGQIVSSCSSRKPLKKGGMQNGMDH